MDSLVQLGIAALEASPYVLFVFLAFLFSHLLSKAHVKEIRKFAETSIQEIRQAYSDVSRNLKKN